jgi:dTDP-4-dehydrorhamnose reductase
MSEPRILLLGAGGQVGTALQPRLATLGQLTAHDRASCDLANLPQLREAVRAARPQLIVNAAAYTAVDKAETEQELCRRINADAPRLLAEEARNAGAWLIHYSTDYVFDGAKPTAYTEDDATAPLNVYGRTKLAGDRAIMETATDYTILRVSWVYGERGRNFANTILRLAAEKSELRIVADQFGAPTSAALIADTTAEIIKEHIVANDPARAAAARGLFNLAPAGRATWHSYAVALVREARRQGWPLTLTDETIVPIPAAQYPTPATRPQNSMLDTTRIRRLLGRELPDWREPLKDFIAHCRPA